MNIGIAVVIGLMMGLVFGFALEKSRVFEPGVIVGQMRLRNFIMLKVFLTAVATGLVVLAFLHGFGFTQLYPKATVYGADILGGLLLGAGIAVAGACPGTVFAQMGAGYRSALWTFAGGFLGAMAFGYLEPALKPLISGGPGKVTLQGATGLPYPLLAIGAAVILVVLLVVLERWQSWRSEVGADYSGIPPGPRKEPVTTRPTGEPLLHP